MFCYRYFDEADRACRRREAEDPTTHSLSAVTCRRCLEEVLRRTTQRLATLSPATRVAGLERVMLPDLQNMLAAAPVPPMFGGTFDEQKRHWANMLAYAYRKEGLTHETWIALHRAILNAVVPG